MRVETHLIHNIPKIAKFCFFDIEVFYIIMISTSEGYFRNPRVLSPLRFLRVRA